MIKVTGGIGEKVKNVYDDYNFTPEKFKPHMTIAERIPEDVFIKIKGELEKQKESGQFIVNSVFLYKLEKDNNQWESLQEINFGL